MKPASEKLKNILDKSTFKDAIIPVVNNVSAEAVTNASDIQDGLIKQVYSSVLWEDSVRYMIEQGVTTFVEIGSGKVLTGLIKKIDRNVNVYNIFDEKSLQETLEKMEETTC
jgi:[acyl-carrier-protein] S-malonyltransferase